MSDDKIDKIDIRGALSDVQVSRQLAGDRLLIFISLLAAVSSALMTVYLALGKDRLEVVYLQQDKIDAPTLLTKVRLDDDSVRTDRWVRGFVRRFLGYYFLSADDSKDYASKALGWVHAHTGEAGKYRSESLASGFEKFDAMRRTKYTSFFPINDPSSLRIRQSSEDNSLIFVEIPGTFVTKTQEGESFFDSKLKLVITRVPVSGIDSGLGEINVTGLSVLDGTIEYVEDYTRPGEVSRLPLFPKENG